jgi:hypothetical protein
MKNKISKKNRINKLSKRNNKKYNKLSKRNRLIRGGAFTNVDTSMLANATAKLFRDKVSKSIIDTSIGIKHRVITTHINKLQDYYKKLGNNIQASFIVSRILWELSVFTLRNAGLHTIATFQEATPAIPEIFMITSTVMSSKFFKAEKSSINSSIFTELIFLLYNLKNDMEYLAKDLKLIYNSITGDKKGIFKKIYRGLVLILDTFLNNHIKNIELILERINEGTIISINSFRDRQIKDLFSMYSIPILQLKNKLNKIHILSDYNTIKDDGDSLVSDIGGSLVSDIEKLLTTITSDATVYYNSNYNSNYDYQSELLELFPYLTELYYIDNASDNFVNMVASEGLSKARASQSNYVSNYMYLHSIISKLFPTGDIGGKTGQEEQEQQMAENTFASLKNTADNYKEKKIVSMIDLAKEWAAPVATLGTGLYYFFLGGSTKAITAVGLATVPHVFLMASIFVIGVFLISSKNREILQHMVYQYRNINRIYSQKGSEIIFNNYIPACLNYYTDEEQPIEYKVLLRIGYSMADFIYRHSLYFCNKVGNDTIYVHTNIEDTNTDNSLNDKTKTFISKKLISRCNNVKYPSFCQDEDGHGINTESTGVCNYHHVSSSNFPFRYMGKSTELNSYEGELYKLLKKQGSSINIRKNISPYLEKISKEKDQGKENNNHTQNKGFLNGLVYFILNEINYIDSIGYTIQKLFNRYYCCKYILPKSSGSNFNLCEYLCKIFYKGYKNEEGIEISEIYTKKDINDIKVKIQKDISKYIRNWKPETESKEENYTLLNTTKSDGSTEPVTLKTEIGGKKKRIKISKKRGGREDTGNKAPEGEGAEGEGSEGEGHKLEKSEETKILREQGTLLQNTKDSLKIDYMSKVYDFKVSIDDLLSNIILSKLNPSYGKFIQKKKDNLDKLENLLENNLTTEEI